MASERLGLGKDTTLSHSCDIALNVILRKMETTDVLMRTVVEGISALMGIDLLVSRS